MRIGFLGAGPVARSVAARARHAGHDVLIWSRRGPEALAPVIDDVGGEAVDLPTAAGADLVVLAVPWPVAPDVLASVPDWTGRVLVDATNPFVETDPLVLADLGGRSASVVLAEHAPGARVVKAFNNLTMADFDRGPTEGEARRVLFVSGDDEAAKTTVTDLITSIGYAAVGLGGLEDGGRLQQAGGPLAGRDLLLRTHAS